jgi:hypothetical protein
MSGPLILAYDLEGECQDHGQVGNQYGYGTVYVETEAGHKRVSQHRARFEMVYGFRPKVVMHLCDNTRCVNPNHLQAGTPAMNNGDRARKGRSAKNVHSRRRLTDGQVRSIRDRFSPNPGTNTPNPDGYHALARDFGVNIRAIYQIVNRHTYKDVI